MRRVVILGNAGSGKSTLARQMSVLLNLPVVHLDQLFWEPGWVKADHDIFRSRVDHALSTEGWISEGNYHRLTFDLRLPHADLVIWLDTHRVTCLKRVIARSLSRRPRLDLPAGCREKLDEEFCSFLRYVWNFDRDSRPAIEAEQIRCGPLIPTVHLAGSHQINNFLAQCISRSALSDVA